MRGLYAIVDMTFLVRAGLEPLDVARSVISARPAALQLRAKDLAAREVLGLLRALAPLCRHARVPLVANDRPDLAVLAGCDYVHVGQDDVPLELARRIAPGLGIGVSTHSLAELERALLSRPSYVNYGPVFATPTRPGSPPPVGLEELAVAAAIAGRANVPIVAIGGIDVARAPEVAAIVPCGAVISGLVAGTTSLDEVRERAALLHRVLGGDRTSAAPPPAPSARAT